MNANTCAKATSPSLLIAIQRNLAVATAMLMLLIMVTPAYAVDIKQGTFREASGHDASGQGQLVQTPDGSWEIRLAANFAMDRAPDPWIALGRGGKYVPGTLITRVKSRRGAQTYAIPANIDPSSFDTIVLWCKPYSVPIGYAIVK